MYNLNAVNDNLQAKRLSQVKCKKLKRAEMAKQEKEKGKRYETQRSLGLHAGAAILI